VPVRTTLTIDDDVAAGLRRAMRTSGRSFRAVVNETLRTGLEAPMADIPQRFVVKPRALGVRAGVHFDSISELLDDLDGPDRR
jgi:hypothetical protein